MKLRVLLALLLVLVGALAGCSGRREQSPDATSQVSTATIGEAQQNHEWFVVFSRGLTGARLQECGSVFFEFVGNKAVPGDVVNVLSAPDHTPVASFVVPGGNANARLRHKSLRPILPQLRQVFEPNGESHARLGFHSLVAAVTGNRSTRFPVRIVMFGSPIFNDPDQGGWAMTDGVVPTDRSIGAELSPFLAEKKYPDGTLGVMVAPAADWGLDFVHRQHVNHFNRVLFQAQNGNLVRVADNPSLAFAFEPPQFTEPEVARNDGFGVRQVSWRTHRREGDVEIGDDFVPEIDRVSRGENERPEKSLDAVIRNAQANPDTIAVAIQWTSNDANADLDMYLTSAGDAGELYFGNQKAPWGTHFRDVQATASSQSGGDDYRRWEWLEVKHGDIEKLTLWVNCYRISEPATVRVVRVWKGIRQERTIEIKCTEGDGGRNRNWRGHSRAWVRVQLDRFKADEEAGSI